MRKKLFSVIVLVILSNCITYAQKANHQVMALAFYNMENFFDYINDPNNAGDDEFTPSGTYHYTEQIYDQKLHNLATVLQQLGQEVTPDGPALIGCAEIENDKVLQDLIAQPEIKDRHYRFVHFDSPDERGIDVALIYNPKYFRVIEANAIPVNISGTGGKETTRDVLHVFGILGGDSVHVFVNHWPSRRGGEAASAPKRAIAAQVNKHCVDSLLARKPTTKIIVMGDLNDDPTNASVMKVLEAKGEKESVMQTDLYNPFVKLYQNGIGTLAYDDKWDLFDQIIFSGEWLKNDSWSFYKAEIFNKDFLIEKFGQYKGYPHRSFEGTEWNNGYSDHFPSIVYLIDSLSN